MGETGHSWFVLGMVVLKRLLQGGYGFLGSLGYHIDDLKKIKNRKRKK